MISRAWCLLLAGGFLVGTLPGCGKRGNPLAPLRPLAAPVGTVTARRVGDRIELRFTIPTENADHSTPPAMTRIEIYAAPGPQGATPLAPMVIPVAVISMPVASAPLPVTRFRPVMLFPAAPVPKRVKASEAPALTPAALMTPKHLHGHVDVRPPEDPDHRAAGASPTKPDDTRPAAGDVVTYSEQVATERAAGVKAPEVSVLRYVVVGAYGRRLGMPSPVLEIALGAEPVPPTAAAVTYDETSMSLTWTAGAPGQTFRVYRADDAGKEQGGPLNAAPLTVAQYASPVEFGVERCFVVHSAVVRGAVSIESNPTPPVCKTAVDTFPPPVPSELSAQPIEGKITLEWKAVSAADLAGYIVMRAEGANGTLRPLTADPIRDTSYADTSTKIGVTYVYAIVAVDKAGNRSAPSARVEEIGR